MSSALVRWSVLAALCCVALVGSPQCGRAQGGQPDKVKIQTIDGVELKGHFYACSRKNAPTVLVLHSLGGSSQSQGWKNLAQTLQSDFSVMLFDFRGHGDSKTVDPTIFWKYQPNSLYAGKKASAAKSSEIDYKEFEKTSYFPVLVNDIAAVKGYLDRQSDRGICNTSSFILIGAEGGAALGAIWLNSEWYRHKMQLGPAGVPQMDQRPEGKDTIAAVWLSMSRAVGKRTFTPAQLFELAGRAKATPMLFVYGSEDSKGKAFASEAEKYIKGTAPPKGVASPHKYTGAPNPPPKTNLTGVELLQTKTLKTDAIIKAWLDLVVGAKENERAERDFQRSQYIWNFPGSGPQLAKPQGELNLVFDNYEKFMR